MLRLKFIAVMLMFAIGTHATAQENLPLSTDNILIFVEPFEDAGIDKSQSWLSKGLPGFLKTALDQEPLLHCYITPDYSPALVDWPHRYQNMIWKSVFQRQVNPAYETYMILGNFAYLEGDLIVRMELLSLRDTRVLASFEESLSYTKLLSWKTELSRWVLEQLKLLDGQSLQGQTKLPAASEGQLALPGIARKEQIQNVFSENQKLETVDLKHKYEQQSRMKLGSQIEQLWQDIAFEPYLAQIHDIQTLRLQAEPDSVAISFKVSYRINPRILDEIEHFSRTRAGLVKKTETYEAHAFMDLGYIDADFVSAVAGGDWRVVPIISLGAKGDSRRRVFYHSWPRPVEPPSSNYHNAGEFKQLLLAVPGVNALRIFVQESLLTYEYNIVVGYDEMNALDKIQVSFVPEQELSSKL